MTDGILISSIATAIAGSTAVLIAATGELLVEKVGVYNIGLEGVMLVGALSGFMGTAATDSWIIGLLIGGLIGALFALVFGVLTVLLRADMIVVGIALILVALGLTEVVGESYVRDPAASLIPTWEIPLLSKVPYVGDALFQQSVMTYVAFALPFGVAFLFGRTRHGLNMRAIGENPEAADAAGIAVIGWRLTYVAIGGAFAGIGGAVLSLGILGTWLSNITAGQGWIAFALVFLAGWRPIWLLGAAYMFGALTILGNVGQAEGWSIPNEVFTALPYLGTVVVMVVRAWIGRRRGGVGWPAALGTPFYRG
jgi:simple sugar transport system permease protein